jgi:hypothetical protein
VILHWTGWREKSAHCNLVDVALPVAVEANVKLENTRLSIVRPPAVLRPMSVAYVPELGQVAGAAFAKGTAHAEMNKNVSKTSTRTICVSPFGCY